MLMKKTEFLFRQAGESPKERREARTMFGNCIAYVESWKN